jgi:NADH-quinone oxidoreductase subunit N
MSWQDVSALAPILWTTVGGLAVLLADAFIRRQGQGHLLFVAVVFLALAGASAFDGLDQPARSVFAGALSADAFASFFQLTFIIVAALSLSLGSAYFRLEGHEIPEYAPLLMFATVGMMVMAAATDMIAIFLGLETMSIALYVLAAIQRRSAHSNEAGFKYLILGAFSSAFLLYGMAMLYGVSGSTHLPTIAANAAASAGTLSWLGWGLVLVGLGFKIAMVPFHMWTPDVYAGAPAPVVGFMAAGVKAASFAALLRLVWTGLPEFDAIWFGLLAILAVATMCVGNILALAQGNLKRMLAYSAIAHAGYLLVGVIASTPASGDRAAQGMLFYLFVYALMNVGAFGLIGYVHERDGERCELAGFSGLSRRSPAAAAAMTVLLLSLAGVPPTAGFWGKLYVFEAAVREGHLALAVIAVLNSAVAMYYYLRVVVIMYMREPGEVRYERSDLQAGAAMLLLAAAILWIGLQPSPVAELARRGVEALANSL